MGNAIIQPCFQSGKSNSYVKLVLWEGTIRVLTGRQIIAGEIMFEFPDRMVCHADSFFIGQPIPTLALDDELVSGQTYFVLPIDCFACNILSASSIASFVASPNKRMGQINFKDRPFEYIKGINGRVMIKVMPEFMTKLMIARGCDGGQKDDVISNPSFLCSTPELKKQYDMLVGSKEQLWTPKLGTISESNGFRFSPRKLVGFVL